MQWQRGLADHRRITSTDRRIRNKEGMLRIRRMGFSSLRLRCRGGIGGTGLLWLRCLGVWGMAFILLLRYGMSALVYWCVVDSRLLIAELALCHPSDRPPNAATTGAGQADNRPVL